MDKWTCMICDDGKELGPEEMVAHFNTFHKEALENAWGKDMRWPDGEEATVEEYNCIRDIIW